MRIKQSIPRDFDAENPFLNENIKMLWNWKNNNLKTIIIDKKIRLINWQCKTYSTTL